MIAPGINGFLITPGDTGAMAEAVCKLIEDTETRQRMGAASFSMARDYTSERVIPRWENLLEDLATKDKNLHK